MTGRTFTKGCVFSKGEKAGIIFIALLGFELSNKVFWFFRAMGWWASPHLSNMGNCWRRNVAFMGETRRGKEFWRGTRSVNTCKIKCMTTIFTTSGMAAALWWYWEWCDERWDLKGGRSRCHDFSGFFPFLICRALWCFPMSRAVLRLIQGVPISERCLTRFGWGWARIGDGNVSCRGTPTCCSPRLLHLTTQYLKLMIPAAHLY